MEVLSHEKLNSLLLGFLKKIEKHDVEFYILYALLYKTGLRYNEIFSPYAWEYHNDYNIVCLTSKNSNDRKFTKQDLILNYSNQFAYNDIFYRSILGRFSFFKSSYHSALRYF